MKNIERWYSGKALETIRTFVLPALAEAEKLGYWPKGVSRKVHAALNKQTVAAKFAKANRAILENLSTGDGPYDGDARGHVIQSAMFFGSFGHAEKVAIVASALRERGTLWGDRDSDWKHVEVSIETAVLDAMLKTAQQWAADFAPVAALVKVLDARRPLPVIVCKSLSPTVAQNLTRSLAIDVASVMVPPIKYTWRMVTDSKTGKTYEIAEGEIQWPEGTQHNRSRYAYGSGRNWTCHACGHAIRDPYNWVPLVAAGKAGPLSLWVGRDCAKKIFDADVSGDALYSERQETHIT